MEVSAASATGGAEAHDAGAGPSPSLSFPPSIGVATTDGAAAAAVESSYDSSLSSGGTAGAAGADGKASGGFPSGPTAGGGAPSYFYSSSSSTEVPEAGGLRMMTTPKMSRPGQMLMADDGGAQLPQGQAAAALLTPTTAASSSYAATDSSSLYGGIPAVSQSMSLQSDDSGGYDGRGQGDGGRMPLPAPLLPPDTQGEGGGGEAGGGGDFAGVSMAMALSSSPANVSELGASFDGDDDRDRSRASAAADARRSAAAAQKDAEEEDARWSQPSRQKAAAASKSANLGQQHRSINNDDDDSAVALLRGSPSPGIVRRGGSGNGSDDGTADAKSSPDDRDIHKAHSGVITSRQSHEFEVSFDGSAERFPAVVSAPSFLSRCSPGYSPGSAPGGGGGGGKVARPESKELFLGRFSVADGDPLRHDGDEAVLRALDWGPAAAEEEEGDDGPKNGAAPPPSMPTAVTLKALDDPDAARAELAGRRGVDARYVLPILAILADGEAPDLEAAAAVPGEDEQIGKDDARGSAEEDVFVRFEKRDGLIHEIQDLIASRQPLPASSGGDSGSGERGHRRNNSITGPPPPPPRFRYLLILEAHSATLEDDIAHGRVDLALARNVLRDVSVGLILLHAERVVHGGVEPRSIVRCDRYDDDGGGGGGGPSSLWKLTDLGHCRCTGATSSDGTSAETSISPDRSNNCHEQKSGRKLHWASQPPEAASALLASSPPQPPDPTQDLWALGAVLHRLLLGRPLFCPASSGAPSRRDLELLATWSGQEGDDSAAVTALEGGGGNDDSALCAATDLMNKLLAPTAAGRRSNFELGTVSVHKHEFISGRPLEKSALDAYVSRRDARRRAQAERAGYDALTAQLSLEERWEFNRMRDVLLLGMFDSPCGGGGSGEASPSTGGVPTSFVILREKLPRRQRGEGMTKREIATRLEEGLGWIDRLSAVEDSVRGALVGDISCIGHFWGKIGNMFGGDYMYLYFLDELTGEPIVEDDSSGSSNGGGVSGAYPLEVATWSDVVPCLLPLMHLTMRAMALYHGVAGIARMFGAALPPGGNVPEDTRARAQARVDRLKCEREDRSAPFGAIDPDLGQLPGAAGNSIRWKSMLDLMKLLEKNNLTRRDGGNDARFPGGLARYSDMQEGRAIWTALLEAKDVKRAVRKRSEEFLQEVIRKWVDGREDEMDALERDLRTERAASGGVAETLSVTNTELNESTGTVDFLKSRIEELQASLDHVKQGLATANNELDRKRSVSKGRSMFGLKKSVKSKKKETQSLIRYDEVGDNNGHLSNEI